MEAPSGDAPRGGKIGCAKGTRKADTQAKQQVLLGHTEELPEICLHAEVSLKVMMLIRSLGKIDWGLQGNLHTSICGTRGSTRGTRSMRTWRRQLVEAMQEAPMYKTETRNTRKT